MNKIIEANVESEEIEAFSILMRVSPERNVEGVALQLKGQYNFGPDVIATVCNVVLNLHLSSVPDEGKAAFLAQFVNGLLGEINKHFEQTPEPQSTESQEEVSE